MPNLDLPMKDEKATTTKTLLKSQIDFYDQLNEKFAAFTDESNNKLSDCYLELRDLVYLIKKYAGGGNELDSSRLAIMEHGCGTGRPIRHLKKHGLTNVVGCDINEKMLEHAKRLDANGVYLRTSSVQTPFESESFDVVLSLMVILVNDSKQIIADIFREAYRTLKPKGLFIVCNSSKELYSHEHRWRFTEAHMFGGNRNLTSGCKVTNKVKGMDLVFEDFYWSDEDVLDLAGKTNFRLVDIHEPLGTDADEIDWLDERHCSPFRFYIFFKQYDDE